MEVSVQLLHLEHHVLINVISLNIQCYYFL